MIISSGRTRIHSTVATLAVAALAVTGAVTVVGRTPIAVAAIDSLVAPVPVEDEGADCPVPEPGSSTANAKLPDPFRKFDGTRISAKSEWRCRRAEIKKLAERYVYGAKPAKPTASPTCTSP
ncbi:hypothetical protein AB0F68_12985 [Micromonospora sp. NPDC023966]|uniref:hypothetical protein n=1 Tax=Micromonospora sp. NPDC023966 TaxID=3154699 RepID=UPI0033E94AB6